MKNKMDITLLDKIIKDTVKHLEEGKQQISDIAESVRQERDSLYNNLLEIKKKPWKPLSRLTGWNRPKNPPGSI